MRFKTSPLCPMYAPPLHSLRKRGFAIGHIDEGKLQRVAGANQKEKEEKNGECDSGVRRSFVHLSLFPWIDFPRYWPLGIVRATEGGASKEAR